MDGDVRLCALTPVLQADGSEASDGSDSEAESEFDSDLAEEEPESTDYSESGSDFGASDASGSDEGSAQESDEGEDWDELEAKAARADQKRHERGEISGSDDDAKRKAKKSKGGFGRG